MINDKIKIVNPLRLASICSQSVKRKYIVDTLGPLPVILLVMDAGNNNSVSNTVPDKSKMRSNSLTVPYYSVSPNFGKITRFIAIVAMSLFGGFSSAYAQEQYHNDKLKFSFVLPEGWERTPYDKLSDHYRFYWDHIRDKMMAMELFSVESEDSLRTPYIYLEGNTSTSKSEKELEKHYLSYKGREHEYIEDSQKSWQRTIDWLRAGNMGDPKSWKGAELIGTDFYYDQEKHAIFKTIELYHERVGKILYEHIRLLGSRRRVSLSCYWDGENPDEFFDLLDGIVDSFSYDKGYGFGETVGVITAYKKKAWKKLFSGGLLGVIGFAIFVYILNRWADR